MLIYSFLVLLNGMIIGTSRTINGRLAVSLGAFRASYWNHLIGFLFLTLLLTLIGFPIPHNLRTAPPLAFTGGIFGALFVAVNSYVFPRIGAIRTALVVISGQMLSALFFDYHIKHISVNAFQLLGLVFILLGVYLAKLPTLSRRQKEELEHA